MASRCTNLFQQRGISWQPCRVSGVPAVPCKSHFHSRSAPQDDAQLHPVNLEKSNFAGVRGSRRFGPFHFAAKATQRVNNMTAVLRCCTGLHKCKPTQRKAAGIFKSSLKRNNVEFRKRVKKRSWDLEELYNSIKWKDQDYWNCEAKVYLVLRKQETKPISVFIRSRLQCLMCCFDTGLVKTWQMEESWRYHKDKTKNCWGK